MEKKINIGKDARVSIVWNVKPTDATKEKEKSIISLFAKKYDIPESHVTVEKKYITNETDGQVALNSDNIKNILDPKFQQSLFKPYLAENGISEEDYDYDELIKIDTLINAQIDYNKYEKSKHYTIKWLDWSNFLSYGKDNHFDFTQLHGLVLLNGVPANKSGKSTFAYDLLHFLLFGKTKSGKADSLGELFNNYLPNETELKVEGCINIEGADYIIKRTLTRPAKSKKAVRTASQKVEYYRLYENGVTEELKDEENLQEESSVKTNKVIKEAIGNESDFDLIISANAKDLDDLISLKEDARGKLLSRWIGLSVIEDKDVIARQKWNKEISVGRYCDIYNRESLKSDIDKMNEENKTLKELILANNKKIEECDKTIEAQNQLKDAKLKSKKPVDENIKKLGDTTTLERKKADIVTEGKKKAKESEALQKQINDFGDISYSDEEYKKLQNEKEDIIEKQGTLKSQYDALVKENENLASAEYCPLCKRKFEDVDNSALIESNKAKMKKFIENGKKLKARKEEIIPLMDKIDEKRALSKEKNKLELKLAAIKTDIVTLRSDFTSVENSIKQVEANKEAIKFNDAIDAEINVINETIKIQNNIKTTATNENASYIADGKKNKELIAEKKAYITRIEEEEKIEKNWKTYLKIIGKDGISKMVLRNALPIINNELNRLLNDVTDFDVEVTINEKNDVDFWLIRDGIKSRLSGASGLERTQAALALRVVLGNMSRLSRPPFVLFDEILGTVDAEFYDDMKKLYDKIVNNFDFVIHICHLADWYDLHSQVITVTKQNNISSIKSVSHV